MALVDLADLAVPDRRIARCSLPYVLNAASRPKYPFSPEMADRCIAAAATTKSE